MGPVTVKDVVQREMVCGCSGRGARRVMAEGYCKENGQ